MLMVKTEGTSMRTMDGETETEETSKTEVGYVNRTGDKIESAGIVIERDTLRDFAGKKAISTHREPSTPFSL